MAGNKEYDRRPWWVQRWKPKEIVADPLPPDKVEGDSGDTDEWDDNDTPPKEVE
jgi:hypothetical protein